MSFDIPAGLTDLLQDFTVAVLREKPESSDLVNFAADYFNNLCSNKNFNNVTQHSYNDQYSKGEPLHESMQTESDSDEEPFGWYKLNMIAYCNFSTSHSHSCIYSCGGPMHARVPIHSHP